MLSINPATTSKIKAASSEALARTCNVRFIREEKKFFDSAEKFEGYIDSKNLKAIPEFFKSMKHMGKMAGEKLKGYYFLNIRK